MNVIEGLRTIRQRLVDNGANDGDACPRRPDHQARLRCRPSATLPPQSLLQLTRMLMRHPDGIVEFRRLQRSGPARGAARIGAPSTRARRAAEDANKPMPKTKKYYKELKEKQKKADLVAGRSGLRSEEDIVVQKQRSIRNN